MPFCFAECRGFLALFKAEKKNEIAIIMRMRRRVRLITIGGTKNMLFMI